mgnify:CR=1 FL=1
MGLIYQALALRRKNFAKKDPRQGRTYSGIEGIAIGAEPDKALHDPLFTEHVTLLHDLGRGQDPGECIVVGPRDGLELVVMAPRAADGLAEHGLADGVELLVNHVEAELLLVLLLVIRRAEREECRGRELTPALRRIGVGLVYVNQRLYLTNDFSD